MRRVFENRIVIGFLLISTLYFTGFWANVLKLQNVLKAYINDILSNNYNYNYEGDDMTIQVHDENKERHDEGGFLS